MSESAGEDASAADASAPRVQIATVLPALDGRLRVLEILPEPDASAGEDPVLIWDSDLDRPRWASPAELGFSAVPMILDVPVADGSGAVLVDGSGAVIVSNVPSTGA